MGNHHDSIALDWVRGEIQETLAQSQKALEGFVENRDDTARLRFCLNYLHQVHGTLQMVELYGAALLTEEMEKLTQAILDERVAQVDEAMQVLMQAMLQLPHYLEQLESAEDDFPLVLMPQLNDLRASRGESLLSDTSLFKPDLSPARFTPAKQASARLQDPTVLGHVRKLHQMYRFALAGIERDDELENQFAYLQKVTPRLAKLCQKTPHAELWQAAGGFVESLQSGHNPVNAAAKALLRELEEELQRLVDEHIDRLNQPIPEALFKHLLYYVARARSLESPTIQDLVSRYGLGDALPDEQAVDRARERVSGPGRSAISSVVSALNEELAKLKDQLDLFVRSEFRQNQELEDLLPGLQQVSNTLAVIGLGIPRRIINEQIDSVEALARQEQTAEDGALMDIAGALLYVEATLAGLEREGRSEQSDDGTDGETEQNSESPDYGRRELSDANTALLRESRNTLEQVKSAVVNFIASQWEPREIEHVPALLHSVQGGLALVPLERVSDLLVSTERYISRVLLEGRRVPDWQQLDTLADVVTSIEYYLERLADGIGNNENILQIAEDSLTALGFPPGQEPTWDSEQAADTSVEEPAQESLSDDALANEADSSSSAASDRSQPHRSEDLVDDEILEIFVEEAEEVLTTIHHFYPRLRQHYDDREALPEVRRAFHTLKGSGRLVGATSIGELAWSIENLLNRVIDQTIRPTDAMFELVDEVNERIPSLIQEFRQGETSGDVTGLIERAEALATTRKTGDGEPEADAPEPAPAVQDTDSAAPAAAASAEVDSDNDDLIDDEILEIFIEEAGEVRETISEYLPMLLRHFEDRSALAEVRRAFHTLKGSGRMVGADEIGELAWSVENMLNRVIDGSIFMNEDIATLLQDVSAELPGLIRDFENKQPASADTAPLEARAAALANGEIPEDDEMDSNTAGRPVKAEPGAGLDEALVDPVLLDIFESEAQTHLLALENYLEEAGDKTSVAYTDEVSRALHTLKGSAHTAGITPIATVITPLEHFVKDARSEGRRADQDALMLLREGCQFLTRGLAQLRDNPHQCLAGTEAFLARLRAVAAQTLGRRGDEDTGQSDSQADPQLVALFLNDGLDILLDADAILDQWAAEPAQTRDLDKLTHELEQLAEGARKTGLPDVVALAESLGQAYRSASLAEVPPDNGFFFTARAAHENLINMMDQVAAGLATRPDNQLIEQLTLLRDSAGQTPPDAFTEEFSQDLDDIDRSLAAEQPAPAEESAQSASEEELPEVDDELAGIFLEEAQELIDSSADALHDWTENPARGDLLQLLQRDLHTLKGGARLSAIHPVGDLAHELESLFEALQAGHLTDSEDLHDLLLRCHDRLASQVESLAAGESPRPAPDLLAEIRATRGDSASPASAISDEPEPALPPLADVEENANEEESRPEPEEPASEDLPETDPELIGIFLEEAYDLINSTGSALHGWSEDPSNHALAAELQRDVHTLKGGARMAGADAIGDLTHVLEDLFEKVTEGEIEPSTGMNNVLFACHDRLAEMVDQVATQRPCPPAEELVSQVRAILAGDLPTTAAGEAQQEEPAKDSESRESSERFELPLDSDLINLFLDESREVQEAIEECLAQWREEPEELTGVAQLQQELQTLKGGARLADVDPVADLAEAWHQSLEPLMAGSGDHEQALALSGQASDSLKTMLDQLEETQPPLLDTELHAALLAAGNESSQEPDPTEEREAQAPVDAEVLEIFLEEADELLDQLEHVLADWRKEPANEQFNREAQRALHTLKGGARLSQQPELGDEAHALETRLIDLGGNPPAEADWQIITEGQDRLLALVSAMRKRYEQMTGQAPEPDQSAVAEKKPAADTPADTAPAPVTPAPQSPSRSEPRKPAQRAAAEAARAAQETIRVSAPLLDEMVNLAGETSITRGRLEQQTSDFGHTLDEMAATIDRLREQLRRMDIETEAQILSRAEKEYGPDYGEDFDPLEMDRYSSIQQLSRALSESSSDLADLRETLSDRVRDTETLLVQQSRINTELQEGLMKTRMIPFASMVPRLRRIVRQISGELGKRVEFDVRNPEGEMDRTILERMIAPLEHMLRNALDHGIETPGDRRKAGKPETGEVTLSLTREGGEVVLRMMDDGAGIPPGVIRDKAIRQGLLGRNEDLTDREVLQFILQPGFSTAAQVTQISGRGVGMDVVASEIKQLGGSLDIDSAAGRGTTFTVRLPFTVSVNRALMVSTGEDFYAIPLNTIEGIVRVSTWELEEYYQPDAPMYEYAGQQYRLQYLGGLLHSDHQPKLQGQALPLPVILVRGAEQPMALQVDSLMGSREIVVKSLGPQFNTVRGVSGATILGDGNVVVILDLPAMIRSDILSERQRLSQQAGAAKRQRLDDRITTVMVVDDSVTVRKVTSRLLERNGMDVITAKDGLDAVAQLQDHRPDIILLDIEMPRMDGFEVASFIRHDETLKGTPICMITSRTGQKHRERALAIGVNDYLGKPFQEADLLDTIQRLTGED